MRLPVSVPLTAWQVRWIATITTTPGLQHSSLCRLRLVARLRFADLVLGPVVVVALGAQPIPRLKRDTLAPCVVALSASAKVVVATNHAPPIIIVPLLWCPPGVAKPMHVTVEPKQRAIKRRGNRATDGW